LGAFLPLLPQRSSMDCYDAARAIRKAGFEVSIIAMAANTMKGDRDG